MTETCPGTYISKDACLSESARYFDGSPADTAGNSLGCRLYHVNLARTSASSAATHCPHAAADGGDICTDCNSYCSKFFTDGATAVCSGKEGGRGYFTDNADCLSLCESYYPRDSTFDSSSPTINDSLQCREYHAGAAASDAVLHCPHASPFNEAAPFKSSTTAGFIGCADQCDFYCDIVATNCFGSNKLYDDKTECRKYCAGLGTSAATG
jgi:hypothetical protein